MTNFPSITAATAAVLAVLQVLLMLYAARGRGQYRVGLGDGGNPAMLRRIRMHGNLAENVPLFLILLLLVETGGQWAHAVPWFAAVFVVARIAHPIGLTIGVGANPFRFLGAIGTAGSILGLAVLLAISLSHDTHWAHF